MSTASRIIITAIQALSLLWTFAWGGKLYLKAKKSLYLQMIVLAAGCMLSSRLFDLALLVSAKTYPELFHVDFFGMIGCLVFIFGANFGQMDSLVDDGSRKLLFYRLFPLVMNILPLYFIIRLLLSGTSLLIKIEYTLVLVILAHAMYYNLKHLIIPDIEYGFVSCFRRYNLLMLIIEHLFLLELCFRVFGSFGTGMAAVYLLTSCAVLFLVPTLRKGVALWMS